MFLWFCDVRGNVWILKDKWQTLQISAFSQDAEFHQKVGESAEGLLQRGDFHWFYRRAEAIRLSLLPVAPQSLVSTSFQLCLLLPNPSLHHLAFPVSAKDNARSLAVFGGLRFLVGNSRNRNLRTTSANDSAFNRKLTSVKSRFNPRTGSSFTFNSPPGLQ